MQNEIKPLLELQKADRGRLEAETNLKRLPTDLALAYARIQKQCEADDAEKMRIRGLEVRRKDIDNDLKSAEEQLLRLKNQQLAVKKNEELEALNHEIEAKSRQIGELEESEIAALLEIDDAQEAFEEASEDRRRTIELHEKEIQHLEAHRDEWEQEVRTFSAQAEALARNVSPALLTAYQRIQQRGIRPPWVVAVRDEKCTGCHLKIAGEVASALSRSNPSNTVLQCEHCGRIVFMENH